jgi:hypothetical protein
VLSRHDPSELVVPAVLEPVPRLEVPVPRLEVDHVSQNTQNSLERVIGAVPEVAAAELIARDHGVHLHEVVG